MIRLVMTDLDGTLLREDKTVSERNIAAIRSLKEQGIQFGIATGRPLIGVYHMLERWGIREYCDCLVGMNGVQLYDVMQDKKIEQHLLDGNSIRAIVNYYNGLDVTFGIYKGEVLYANRQNAFLHKLASQVGFDFVVCDYETMYTKPQTKLLIMCEPHLMADVAARAELLSLPQVNGFQSSGYLFEWMNANASKSLGISQICAMRGYTMQDVVVFGDHDNDLEMLRDAGIGVCMANGSERAKQAADVLTLSNEEDGLAVYVETKILVRA